MTLGVCGEAKSCASSHFGPLLGYCDHQIHTYMGQRLREYGVTPMQCRTLTYLHEARSPVNQQMLVQFLMVRPSTVNGIVTRLEEKGFIVRGSSSADGRCRILTLTEQGRAFYDAFCDIVAQATARMEQGFRPEELETLRELLLRLARNLTPDGEVCP